MKVLIVSGPSAGGISAHIKQLHQGLGPLGVEVALAPPVHAGPSAALKIARELKRNKYDLVHCHGFQGSAVGRIAANYARIPAIVTIHNTLQVSGITNMCARLTESWLQKRTAFWVTVSSYLRNYAWRVLGVPGSKTQVITNGIDVPEHLPPWCNKPVLGIVARLIPAKGVDVFLRAVQLLHPEIPDLRAVIIGDGPARGQLQALSRELGVENVVSFLGHCSDVPNRLLKTAIFVLPTRCEGLGISIMEAMAMGVPVIATNVGGVPELIRHGDTGILVNCEDYGAIAGHARGIIRDPQGAEALRKAAYRHIADNYKTGVMLEQIYQLYRRVVDA